MAASWTASDWFGEMTGLLNSGTSDAEDVLVRSDDGAVLADLPIVAPGAEVPVPAGTTRASISWHDGTGMHADVLEYR